MLRYMLVKWVRVFEAVVVAMLSAALGFLLVHAVDDCVPDTHEEGEEAHGHDGYVRVCYQLPYVAKK